jgi:hypothetical protein
MRNRELYRAVLMAIVCLCAGLSYAATGGGPSPAATDAVTPECGRAGEVSPQLDIRIVDPQSVVPGETFFVSGEIVFRENAPNVTVSFTADGQLATTAQPMVTGPLFEGEVVPFEIPVSCKEWGKGLVHVLVEVTDELGEPLYFRRTTFYALLEESGNHYGRGGFQPLEIENIDEDANLDLMTAEEAEEASLALRRLKVVDVARPLEPAQFTPLQMQLNSLVGLPAGGALATTEAEQSGGTDFATITVQGQMRWQDETGAWHPVWGARIEIRDDELIGSEQVTVTITDQSGNYSAVVDNDDGIGAGGRDIFVRYKTRNAWVDTKPTGIFSGTYEADSSISHDVADGSVIVKSLDFPSGGSNDANSVFQASTWIAAYVAFDAEGSDPSQVDIIWPNGDDGSFYDGDVQIEQDDRWDWDTVHHEYGHYIQDELNIEDNPGGEHAIGDCVVDVRSDDKSEGNRLSWAEGWPTFFGTSAQLELNMASLSVPRVGDTSYQDLEDTSLVYSLETQDNDGRGEDNEVAVQRLLFDLYDTNSDSRDTISLSDNSIWNTVKAAAGSPHILSHYWAHLRSGKSNQVQIQMGEIATDHQIGPRLSFPAEGAIVSPSNNTFSWDAEVGCPASYDGNQFDLVFYDAATYAKLLTKSGIGTTTYDLSLADLQTLTATTHDVLWGVEGYHTPSPGTGPYLGETFAVTVNQPPVADAGMDRVVECASPTTTPVTLDGTGSYDPDGDPLTYSWFAPGVSFDDPTSPTPTGGFPRYTTTTATLTVDDGIESDTDDVDIEITDTTPPVIVCPADIVVECTATGGTPASDPQLVPFFAGVSASDVCDTTPDIADNAPSFFSKGETTVTFTATDDSGNVAACSAKVTVVDTTPPEISVEMTPDVMWPPNHKFWTITAEIEVEDVCDPDPQVELVSISSNEQANGNGDGNTSNDIRDADFGTDDREFMLRAERAGGGDGRIYTITYRATDCDGNAAEDSAEVRVPHDRGGTADAGDGFTFDGTALDPAATHYQIIIPPVEGVDPTQIDPTHAYVGNYNGVQVPVSSRLVMMSGGELPDLLLTYEAEFVRVLLDASNADVGLHYQAGDGTDYSVPSIFELGIPVTILIIPEPGPGDDGLATVSRDENLRFSQ